MRNMIVVLTFLTVLCIVDISCTKLFTVDDNDKACSLLEIGATVSTDYLDSSRTIRTTILDLDNATLLGGKCGLAPPNSNITAYFQLSFSNAEVITLNFTSDNSLVSLANIQYRYSLPSPDYPNATTTGTFTSTGTPNMKLSSVDKYFICRENIQISLTPNVTLNIKFIKVQVFNVKNGSFATDKDECPMDFGSSTFSPSTSTTTLATTTIPSSSPATTTLLSSPATTTILSSPATTTILSSPATTKPVSSPTTTTPVSSPETTTPLSSPATTTILSSPATTKPVSSPATTTPLSSPAFTTPLSSPATTTPLSSPATTTPLSSPATTTTLSSPATTKSVSSPASTTASPDGPKFSVKDNKDQYVLLLQSPMTLTVNKTYDISSSTPNNGYYNNTSVTLKIFPNDRVSFQIAFVKDGSQAKLDSVTVTVDSSQVILSSQNSYAVPIGETFVCAKEISFSNLKSGYSLIMKKVKFSAFGNQKSDKFSDKETNCERPSPTVAIVVGVVLAVFLLTVLFIFLCMRFRRNRYRGYQMI